MFGEALGVEPLEDIVSLLAQVGPVDAHVPVDRGPGEVQSPQRGKVVSAEDAPSLLAGLQVDGRHSDAEHGRRMTRGIPSHTPVT
eukprot:10483016-Heterocapsa_arctica.AAC.1